MKMKKSYLLFVFTFVVFSLSLLTACSKEGDLAQLSKNYLDANYAYYYDTADVEAFEKTLDDIALPDLKKEKLEAAQVFKKALSDGYFEAGSSQIPLADFYKGFLENKKQEIQMEISPVYDDLNPERKDYKYVFVRTTEKYTNADGSIDEILSHIRIDNYFIQKVDDQWKIYSINEVLSSPYSTDNVTKPFGDKDISFSPYKSRTVTLEDIFKNFKIEP